MKTLALPRQLVWRAKTEAVVAKTNSMCRGLKFQTPEVHPLTYFHTCFHVHGADQETSYTADLLGSTVIIDRALAIETPFSPCSRCIDKPKIKLPLMMDSILLH